jgi:tetratricopeptide (TPR) repeat protein
LIIAKYNYGICLEHLHLYSKAINTYEEIIKSNKCHIDSYLRKAYVLHKLGNSIESLVTLSNAERICKKELVSTAQMEKIHILKAYILFLKGHGD